MKDAFRSCVRLVLNQINFQLQRGSIHVAGVVGRVTPVCAASCNGLLQRRARSDAPYLLSSVSLAGCGIPVYSAFGHKCPVQTRLRNFLLSLPERGVRSATGLAGGLFREVGDVAIPKTIRRSQLYRNLVEATLQFLIEQVGQVKGVYPGVEKLSEDFLVRRTAGSGIELIG